MSRRYYVRRQKIIKKCGQCESGWAVMVYRLVVHNWIFAVILLEGGVGIAGVALLSGRVTGDVRDESMGQRRLVRATASLF